MNTRIVSGLAAVTFAITVLACSSARVEPSASATAVANNVAALPPMQLFQLPPQPSPLQDFKPCKLGQSCLTMDERPFELCLVATKHCADKIQEPLLVDRPYVAPPPNSGIGVSHTTVGSE